jgi:thiamine biosynthesis lipoprotein
MMRLYHTLYVHTGGLVTPTVGRSLEDIGLDAHYSLKEKTVVAPSPDFLEAVRIDDSSHITLRVPVLLDLGALGKGYLVDRLYEFLRDKGCREFLVDGSGDIRYHSASETPITCGLEHPYDTSLAIGTLQITSGALCASATNRRRWGTRNHYINPHTNESPEAVVATWVYAETAADADGLSTALFFVEPEQLTSFSFEYLVVNAHLQKKNSAGFTAEFF